VPSSSSVEERNRKRKLPEGFPADVVELIDDDEEEDFIPVKKRKI
jgi:hypothetical protein